MAKLCFLLFCIYGKISFSKNFHFFHVMNMEDKKKINGSDFSLLPLRASGIFGLS